jgi:hypothetical protein
MKQKARSFAVAAHGDQMYGDKTADRLANVRACLKDSSLSEKAHAGCRNYDLEDAAEAREFLAQFRQYLREHPV